MPQIRFICILATARTGTNRVLSLFSQCKGFYLKGEIFHPDTVLGWTEEDRHALLARAEGLSDDPSICAWRAQHTGETLEALHESGQQRTVVFKIFPQHLRRQTISETLFTREGIAYIVLHRRPIESYISLIKAREVKAFTHVDTTDLRPRLDVRNFIRWSMLVRDWYYWIDAEMKERALPCVHLSYEKDIGIADETEALPHLLDGLVRLGIPRPQLKQHKIAGIPRQDREEGYRNKVRNWSEFEAALLSDPAYAHLLPWATSA